MSQPNPEEMQEKLASMSPEEIKELQKQQCPFCQIVAGKIPVKKIYEDDKVLAILDINPAAAGHVLLLPKEHFPIMPFVPDQILAHLGKIAKYISKAFLKRLLVQGTNIFIANGAVAGQQAQHFLIHLVPREEGDGLEVFNLPEIAPDPELEKNYPVLSQHLYAAMKQYLEKYPTSKPVPLLPKMSEEQLIKLLDQNPQLKEIIHKQPEQFKQLATTHPQLKAFFDGVDLNKFIAKVTGKKEEQVDLDAISSMIDSPLDEVKEAKPEDKKESKNVSDKTKEPQKSENQSDKKKQEKKNKKKEGEVDLDKVLDLLGGDV